MADDRIIGAVGPATPLIDGNSQIVGISRDGALRVAQAHAPLSELASRQKLYAITTAQAGVTLIAEMCGTIAANKQTILSLVNPFNSGVSLHVLRAYLTHISGTPGIGGFSWQMYTGLTTPTGTTGTTIPRGTRTGGVPTAAQGFSALALGASAPAHVLLRAFPSGPFPRALDGLAPDAAPAIDYVDGEIVLDPGSALSIAAAAVGTTHKVMASIVFAEMPYTN